MLRAPSGRRPVQSSDWSRTVVVAKRRQFGKRGFGIEPIRVSPELLQVERDVGQQVHLVQQQNGCLANNIRMFYGLVICATSSVSFRTP